MAVRLRRPGHLAVGPSQVRLPPRSDVAHAHAPIIVSVREPPKLSAKLAEARSRVACSGVWRSLVARFVRDEEVAGSNPVTPTGRTTVVLPPPGARRGPAGSFLGGGP